MDLKGKFFNVAGAATAALSSKGEAPGLPQGPGSRRSERATTQGKSILGHGLDLIDAFKGGGTGNVVNTLIDKTGAPDVVGDVVGLVVDIGTQNYLGAAGNALDIAQDIAKATGHEELEGYLNTGLDGFEFAAGIGVKIGATLATGGVATVGSSALGAAGGALSLGSSGVSPQGILQGTQMLCGVMRAGEAFQQGDWSGGAVQVFAALSNFGPVGQMFGASAQTLTQVEVVAERGAQVAGFIHGAKRDGRLSVGDLRHAPLGAMLDAAGIAGPGREGAIAGLLGAATAMSADQEPVGIVGGLMISVCTAAGLESDTLQGIVGFAGQLFGQSGQGGLAPMLLELLGSAAMDEVPLKAHHAWHMRA